MVSLDTGWKEKAECGGYKRGTGPMRKKSSRRGGKWSLLSKKGRRFVLPPEIDEGGSAAATMVGYAWTARGGAPVAGSRAEPQGEIVKCFDRCRRKETRARGGRPHPGGEIGKVESRCGLGVHSTRCRTPTSFEGRREGLRPRSGFVAILLSFLHT